jgi:hypothetical protein
MTASEFGLASLRHDWEFATHRKRCPGWRLDSASCDASSPRNRSRRHHRACPVRVARGRRSGDIFANPMPLRPEFAGVRIDAAARSVNERRGADHRNRVNQSWSICELVSQGARTSTSSDRAPGCRARGREESQVLSATRTRATFARHSLEGSRPARPSRIANSLAESRIEATLRGARRLTYADPLYSEIIRAASLASSRRPDVSCFSPHLT